MDFSYPTGIRRCIAAGEFSESLYRLLGAAADKSGGSSGVHPITQAQLAAEEDLKGDAP